MRDSPALFQALDIPLAPGEWIALSHGGDGLQARGRPGEGGSRERIALRGGAGQRQRARPGRIRRRGQASRGGESEAARGLLAHLGRPVREPAAGRRPPRPGGADRAGPHLPAALRDVRLGAAGGAGLRQHSVRDGRRHRRALGLGAVPQRARFGRLHRAARHRRAERRGDDERTSTSCTRSACRSTQVVARARSAGCARCS